MNTRSKMGWAPVIIKNRPRPRMGITTRKTSASLGLMVKVSTHAQISMMGQRTAMRMIKMCIRDRTQARQRMHFSPSVARGAACLLYTSYGIPGAALINSFRTGGGCILGF